MADRARRAEARAQRRQEAAEAVVAGEDMENEEDSDNNEEMEETPVRVPQIIVRGPAVAPPLALDPGIWLNMVNVKPPYLEIESMKKFILEYKRYSQKCPRQLLRNMQQFILEEHMEIIVSESGGEYDEIMHLERDDFIGVMLRMHQANSSRKWRLMVKIAKMEKSDLTLPTFAQYVEDFRFWVNAAGRAHRVPEKEIAKKVSGLKPDLFRDEIYARSCETLQEAMDESRAELATFYLSRHFGFRSQIVLKSQM